MVCDDKVNISERIDLAKSNNSKECMICHYWFFNHEFNFQDKVCHGLSWFDTILSVNICDIVITTVKRVDYGYIIHNIIKSKAINLLENFEDGGYIYKILS